MKLKQQVRVAMTRAFGARSMWAVLALVGALTACGGGGGGGSGASESSQAAAGPAAAASGSQPAASSAAGSNSSNVVDSGQSGPTELPVSREAAARFLTQSTFGPTDAGVDKLMTMGYGAWIDAQFALPRASHLADWEAVHAKRRAASPNASGTHVDVSNSFWKQAIKADDQLRRRVALALSEIMVISTIDGTVANNPRGVASYLDMLEDKSTATYRDLLEGVALHPMTGIYLSTLHNLKAYPNSSRVPDENFAREVMQLFTIGLHQVNLDGSPKLDASGQPIATFGTTDVSGLAKVFTGWSWDCPSGLDKYCFFDGRPLGGQADPVASIRPMAAYAGFHSTDTKSFLGVTLPARSDPRADMKDALDTLANHPNVGPFIGRQLIQRLVTSNPSPAYVATVAKVFNDNGRGVRGDMRAVVKAILMNPEARVISSMSGKIREPILRLSAYLRAFPTTSDSGEYMVMTTDDPAYELGQTPLRGPSVFNFYRPGYVAPGTASAQAGLVAPEMQIAHETAAAGYVNYMRNAVRLGIGRTDPALKRRDIQLDNGAEIALADQPARLVDRLNAKLMYGSMPDALKTEISGAAGQIALPTLRGDGSNQAAVANAKATRVALAILLTLASPEFQTQK